MLYAQAMQSGRKRGMKVKDEWERGKRGEEECWVSGRRVGEGRGGQLEVV